MNVLDLFSGIGGFSLGLERAGMRTVAFCEIEPYCRSVLRKHWPDVPIYEDIRTLTADRLASDGVSVDLICGGFPCQDISVSGKRIGLAGQRSGLWREFARLIRELRPRFVIVENVAALLDRGMGDVLGDLAALRYDAEWDCIPAAAIGAPHYRDRIWIVASDSDTGRWEGILCRLPQSSSEPGEGWPTDALDSSSAVIEAIEQRLGEPAIFGSSDGLSNQVVRLGALGNAVVPQIPEAIGRAIMTTLTSG